MGGHLFYKLLDNINHFLNRKRRQYQNDLLSKWQAIGFYDILNSKEYLVSGQEWLVKHR